MCKTHSKVIHIKQQKYFHHLKGRGYNKKSVLYPGRLRWWKYFCCFICVTLLWALHIVIKQQFFYIYLIIMDCWKYCKRYKFALSVARPRAKKISASGGLRPPDPLTKGSALGPPLQPPYSKPPGLATGYIYSLFPCLCAYMFLCWARRWVWKGHWCILIVTIAVSCTISELCSSDCQNTECFGKIENIETGM